MAIQGLRHTNNFVQDERPLHWRAGILMSAPNGKAPLTGLTSAMSSESVDDPEFNWWQKNQQTRRMTLSGNIDASQINIPVDANSLSIKAGDLVMVEQTNEVLYVLSDPTADTGFVAQRGYGTVVAASVTLGASVNPNLVVIGSAYEEGSLAPTSVMFDPTKHFNFTQIFRNTLEMTRTGMKTRLRTGDQVKEAKRECLEIHSIDMERAFWFGQRTEKVKNGKPVRTTAGVTNFIPAENTADVLADHPGGMTMEALEEYMYNMFLYGSNEKMGWCGNRALLTIQQAIRKNSHFNIQSGLKEYGMNVTRLSCPFGELVLKTHPLFNEMRGTLTAPGFESHLVVLDMGEIRYRYIDDTTYEKELQANGMDGKQSGYLTECGLELHHARHHHHLKNLVAAAQEPQLTQEVV